MSRIKCDICNVEIPPDENTFFKGWYLCPKHAGQVCEILEIWARIRRLKKEMGVCETVD